MTIHLGSRRLKPDLQPMGDKALRPKRAPMISFTEAAELFNVTMGQLRIDFMKSVSPPPVSHFRHSNTVHKNTWYIRKEMLVWRKAFLASKVESI